MQNALLTEIENFLAETGMGPSYFGVRSARNPALVKRLRLGSRVWPETEMKIRAFMLVERQSRLRKQVAA